MRDDIKFGSTAAISPRLCAITVFSALLSLRLLSWLLNMVLPTPKAELIGTSLEFIGYGIYVVVFIECMRVLYAKQQREISVLYLWIAALSLFSLVTAHLIIDAVRLSAAFTDNMNVPNAAAEYYERVSAPSDIAKTAVYCTVTLLSDALIVYRLYVVWNRNIYVAVIPLLALFTDIGLSVWFIRAFYMAAAGSSVQNAAIRARATYFWAVGVTLNVLSTFGIAYKIWKVQKSVSDYSDGQSSRLTMIIAIIVESAAVYSAWLLVLIIITATGLPAMLIMLNCLAPVIGTVFSAVIIRVSREPTSTIMTPTLSAPQFAARSRITRRTNDERSSRSAVRHHDDAVHVAFDTDQHLPVDEDLELHKIRSESSEDGQHNSVPV